MPQQAHPGTYDLTVLAPILERGGVILTPNLRLGRRIIAAWNAHQVQSGLQSWPQARVYSLESYLDRRWRAAVAGGEVAPRRLLSAIHLRQIWQRVIDRDQAGHGDYHLLQTEGAVTLAQQARENLLRTRVNVKDSAVRSQFRLDPDCSCYLRWLDAFDGELQQMSAGTLSDALIDVLSAPTIAAQDDITLLDFDDVPRLYRDVLERLSFRCEEAHSDAAPVMPRVFAYPDRRSELDAVAERALAQYRAAPDMTLGIVLSDMQGDRAAMEYALRRAFDCLGDNYTSLPVNFSTGIPLDRAPVVRDALGLLDINRGELPYDDLLMLVRSRFIAPSDMRGENLVSLLRRIADEGAAAIDLGRLRYLAQQVQVEEERGTAFGEALRRTDELRLRHLRQLPSAWMQSFSDVLACWQWPGSGPLDSLEYQQVEHWYRLLEEFAGFDDVCGELSLTAALSVLRDCCRDQISQPQTADSVIQVLGPLEAAGLQFDTLCLCGFQGTRWPAPARPNPFVPVALQRQHQMPHSSAEREWQYAADLMRLYRATCREMVISYAEEIDGVPELPSALLEPFTTESLPPTNPVDSDWTARQNAAIRESVDDHNGPAPQAAELAQLSGGSSILQNQAACPFRAFARNRLRLEPLAEPVMGLSAADRGTLLHNALFILWGEIKDSTTLAGLDKTARELAAERASAAAVTEVPQATREVAGLHCLDLEKQRLAGLLQEWLDIESQRAPFTVSERESSIALELAGIPLNLRVDRIDTLEGGEQLVLDYKSGRNGLADWLGERIAQPQLPLYGLATGVNAVSFAQIRARDCKFTGIGEIDGVPGIKSDVGTAIKRWQPEIEDWPALVAHWREQLSALAEAFVAGEAAVDPTPTACNFCGLQSLCRISVQEASL